MVREIATTEQATDAVSKIVGMGRGGRTGRVELIAVCRRMALEEGDSLDHMLWRAAKGMAHWAERGDAACAKVLFSCFARFEPDGAEPVPDNVTNNTINLQSGPTMPEHVETYMREVEAASRALIAPARVTVEPVDEVDDLLS